MRGAVRLDDVAVTEAVCGDMRDKTTGRFLPGSQIGRKTRFKKGQHWRPRKPWWDRDWLHNEYVVKKQSAPEIAAKYNVTATAIIFWLAKYKIKRRSTSEVRKIKHWSLSGPQNGMFGRYDEANPNWAGGITPDRQRTYSRHQWKELVRSVRERDGHMCQVCYATGPKLVTHRVLSWTKYPAFRLSKFNIVTLCVECHKIMHSKQGVMKHGGS